MEKYKTDIYKMENVLFSDFIKYKNGNTMIKKPFLPHFSFYPVTVKLKT